jgi:hypothetical protein
MSKSIPKSTPSGKSTEAVIGSDGRHPDEITVLQSTSNLRQTKMINADGSSEGAINDTLFRHLYVPVPTLSAIEKVLRQLQDGLTCFVIRGRAIDAAGEIHRRKWAGEGVPLEDIRRKWIMVDIDKPVCDPRDDWQDNPAELVKEIVRKALPDEFHNAGVVWQWSSSMGVKPGTIKVHLWFRLNTAIDSNTAKLWLSPWGMYHDDSVLRTGQPHYTATPVFEGMDDPVRERIGMIEGPDVGVPDIDEMDTFPDFVGGKRVVGRGYEYYRDQIGIQNFHIAMHAAVGAFISKNWPDPDIDWLREDLRQRVMTCNAPGRTQEERQHRAGDHLDKLIEWTILKQTENAERQRQQFATIDEAMLIEAEANDERPSGENLQREFFANLRR